MEWIVWLLIAVVAGLAMLSPMKSVFLKERKKSRQLRIINRIRFKHKLPKLKAYYSLDEIAKKHSRNMAKYHTCNHHGFNRRYAKVRRIIGSGTIGENCFKYPAKKYNKKIAYRLIRGWMKSRGHRQNLLNPSFHKVGIGIISRKGYVYATQIFCS